MLSGDEVELGGDAPGTREVAHRGISLHPSGIPHVAVNRGKTPAVFIGVPQ